jgi:penicillin-binding protein 2
MRAYRDDQKTINLRINILTWLTVAVFFFLAGSFWYVQGVQADKFRGLAESNALRELPIRAKRGLLLDRNGKILADNQAAYQLVLRRSDLKTITKTDPDHRARMLQFLSGTLSIPIAELEKRIADLKIPFNQPLPIAEDLTLPQVAMIEAAQLKFPSIRVEPVQRRNYRYATLGAHVIGYLGEADEKDMEKDKTLKLGDLIGKKGVELVYDRFLRGRDGARYMVVDSHGREKSEYTPAKREPIAGQNVKLTIDFELQRRAEQYFFENEMVGAAVALDPRNGEVLAMVSSPAFDPNTFSRRFTPETWKMINSNPLKIEYNRAIQGLYSPGSVFKVVMGMAGFAYGVITPSTTFSCGGSGVFNGRRFRCWKREGHGAVNFEDALKVSCDIFFYNTGQRLGVNRISDYAHKLTFGETSKIDLQNEAKGLVPNEKWAREKQHRKWYPSETISVAIGQGPLIVTVLQVANLMAAIGNGGILYQPHVVKEIEKVEDNGRIVKTPIEPVVLSRADLPKEALESVRRACWKVVNAQGGTGGNARIAGLDVSGKTGTVQVIAQHGWVKAESLPFKYRDHAWFASFAPVNNPQMVVVVFIEHGGHGGSDAAPLAKLLYERRFQQQLAGTNLNLTDPETLKKLREGDLPTPGQAVAAPAQ